MIESIRLTLRDTQVEFQMDLDPRCVADKNLATMLHVHGGPEPELLHLLFRTLRPGDVAVDGGANIGFFTLLMARLVGYEGAVLAVEPGVNNLTKLRGNIELNRLDQVRVIDKALWSHNSGVTFWLSNDGGENAVAPTEDALCEVRVDTITLNRLTDGLAPKLIKLDCEGSEEHILTAATHIRCPYIVAENNVPAMEKLDCSMESLRTLMRSRGYETFCLHPSGAVPSLIPPAMKLRSEPRNMNVLFSTLEHVAEAWPEAPA